MSITDRLVSLFARRFNLGPSYEGNSFLSEEAFMLEVTMSRFGFFVTKGRELVDQGIHVISASKLSHEIRAFARRFPGDVSTARADSNYHGMKVHHTLVMGQDYTMWGPALHYLLWVLSHDINLSVEVRRTWLNDTYQIPEEFARRYERASSVI